MLRQERGYSFEFCFCCPRDLCKGSDEDREWIEENVPEMEITHDNPQDMMSDFWDKWLEAKEKGAGMFAECKYPVETNFMTKCISEDKSRAKDAPYPFHDISTAMETIGLDSLATYKRIEGELDEHNPLCDTRQSFRFLRWIIRNIGDK